VDGVVLQHQKPSEVIQYNASRLSYRLSADLEADLELKESVLASRQPSMAGDF
jgi:hypothetical protein